MVALFLLPLRQQYRGRLSMMRTFLGHLIFAIGMKSTKVLNAEPVNQRSFLFGGVRY